MLQLLQKHRIRRQQVRQATSLPAVGIILVALRRQCLGTEGQQEAEGTLPLFPLSEERGRVLADQAYGW